MALRTALLLALLWYTSAVLHTQVQPQPDLVFRHLGEKDGMSQNLVNCFLKDRNGMLWVGTYDGLNRFDGAHFTVFKHSNDPASLPQNSVQQLCEDRAGNIWGGTDEGIFCYQPALNRFKNYKKNSAGFKTRTLSICCDREDNVWASGGPKAGLMRLDRTMDQFVSVKSVDLKFALNGTLFFKHGIVEDPSGEGIWLGSDMGLNYYEKSTGRFFNVSNQVNSPIFNKHAFTPLAVAVEGERMWGFDNNINELLQFDRHGQVFRRISLAKDLPIPDGATLMEDRDQRLWFGSSNPAMVTIEYRDGINIQKLAHDPDNSASPAGDTFWDVWQDPDGGIWLGTTEGISICHPKRSFFKVHPLMAQFPTLLRADRAIDCIGENPQDGSWWIGTNYGKIIQYWPRTGKSEVFELQFARPNRHGQMPIIMSGIHFWGGKVLLTTYQGAWLMSDKKRRLEPFEITNSAESSEFIINFAVFEGDSVGWFTDRTRLMRWDIRSGATKIYRFQQDTLSDGAKPSLTALRHFGKEHGIWMIASEKTLAYLDPKQQQLMPLVLDPQDISQRFGAFHDLCYDNNGNIWVSYSAQGLYCYNLKAKKATLRTEIEGLAYHNIMPVNFDRKGRIWTGAYDKISVFDPAENWFYNYDTPEHYRSAGYTNRTMTLANGHIVISVDGDLIEFFPDKLTTQTTPNAPLLSLLQIGNEQKLLTNENLVTLEPDENTIGFHFGTLADPVFFPSDLFYRLDGANTDWVAAHGSSEVVYTNLTPGTYQFRLMAKSKNGLHQSPERTLKVVIRHEFYQTWWFQVSVVLLLGWLGYLYYRQSQSEKMKLSQLERRAEALQKEKALVLYENLKQHLNPHFLFNSLTSLSSLIRIDPPMASDFLDKMSRVYRYILKSREQETVPLGQELNFVKLYIGLQKTRFEDGLVVNLDIPEDYHHLKIAPVTLQNLVENAIKHNSTDIDDPLVIDLFIEDNYLTVRNNLRKRAFVETSNKQGLNNMVSLYTYLCDRPLLIAENEQFFTVKVPLLP